MKHLLFCLVFSIAYPQPSATSSEKIKQTNNQLDALQARSLVAELPLNNIGPSVMSGRVVDLDVNPNATHEFYVAYASGGLWYTDNNGTSFLPVMDNSSTQNIGDIAVHWPTHTLYVGTGENNASRSSYAGTGILKSTDKGSSWIHLGLEAAHHIGKIEINPSNPDEVVVGVTGPLYSNSNERGIYKTTNGGQTWEQKLNLPDPTGIIELSVVPENYKIQYAAAWEKDRKAWDFKSSGTNSGIYKSTDAGNSWYLISTSESGFLQGKGVGRIGLAAFDANTLYAIVDNQERRPRSDALQAKLNKYDFEGISLEAFMAIDNKLLQTFLSDNGFPKVYTANRIREEVRNGNLKPSDLALFLYNANDDLFDTPVVGPEVYRSDDGGQTWSKTHSGYLDDIYYSYGYYFGMVHVSPSDKNHIYIYGVPILSSKDGGKSFKTLDAANLHADHHALWINPKNPKHLVNGNDGGVNISYDGGQNWIKANQPTVGQFYTVYADEQEPYHVYGGLQDNGVWEAVHTAKESVRWHQSGHNPWTAIMGGDGMQIQVDSRNANIVYTGYQFGNYFRIDRDSDKRKYIQPKHKLGEAPFRFNWQTPIQLSAHNNDIIYLGSNKLHRSLNQGDDWKAISDDLTKGAKKGNVPYGTLTAIDESRDVFGMLVVGSDDGLIHLTQNSGTTWRCISNNLPQDLWVSRVQFSKHDPDRIYATLNGYRWDDFSPYVYVSNDLGVSWTDISSNLPRSPVNVIREDATNKNLLYVGTDNGLFVSIDGGKNWHIFNKNLPRVAVHDLFIQEKANHLLVGTHGRSIYMLELDAVQQLPKVYDKKFAVMPPKIQNYNKRWGNKTRVWYDAFSPSFNWTFFSQEPSEGVWTLVSDKGVVVFEQAISLHKGLQQLPYNLTIDNTVIKQFNRKHKTDLKPAGDGNVYMPKGTYTFFWNDEEYTKLVLE
ncbi:MAG: glycosyl hydrolase [Flavobacteriaceae bacterium]|nr:glycosyl hydrolase [Flavobacteriaceae bacterium]